MTPRPRGGAPDAGPPPASPHDEPEVPAPTAGDADRALVARMLAGDEAAFTGLVDAMHGRLSRFVQALVGNAEDTEDVVQDTWLAVISHLAQWQGRAALRTWIYAIATKRARKVASRRGRALVFSALGAPDEEGAGAPEVEGRPPWPKGPDVSAPGRSAQDREVIEEVERAVRDLPTVPQAVIILCDLEGLDAESVCNVLGLSRTNRRVILHRARKRIREALTARFGKL